MKRTNYDRLKIISSSMKDLLAKAKEIMKKDSAPEFFDDAENSWITKIGDALYGGKEYDQSMDSFLKKLNIHLINNEPSVSKNRENFYKRLEKHLGHFRCYLCGNAFFPYQKVTIDHVLPSSLGGKSELDNLRFAHNRCNFLKGNIPLAEFEKIRKSSLSVDDFLQKLTDARRIYERVARVKKG